MAIVATKVGNIGGPSFRATKVSAADGSLSVVFPVGLFKAAPVVVATGVTSDGRDVAVSLVGAPTAAQVKLQTRSSQKVPATGTLASILGFDPFVAVSATVHLIAWASS